MLSALLLLFFAAAETPPSSTAEAGAPPAGRVRIEPTFPPAHDLEARLIHADGASLQVPETDEVFSLHLSLAPGAGAPVAELPAGRAVAAIHSERYGYKALSRPFRVEPGQETPVSPQPPSRTRADFLLALDRPRPARPFSGNLAATLVGIDKERPADALIQSAGRIYALWYGLPAGIHRLVVASPGLYLTDRIIELPGGEVGYLEARLERRPNVKVRLDLPQKLRQAAPLELEMRSLRFPAAVEPWPVASDAREMTLYGVPPVDAEFVLRSPPWAFKVRRDLRSGENGEIAFAPVVTEAFGNLSHGGEPATGRIAFKLPDQPSFDVTTDDLGRYEVSLWRQEVYEVSTDPGDRDPFRRLVEVPLVLEKLIDVDVPAARHGVQAFGFRHHNSLQISQVLYRFVDEQGRELLGEVDGRAGNRVELPPLGFGRIDVTVKAKGHYDARREGIALWPGAPGTEIGARLERVTDRVRLRFAIDGFEPVEGAQVRVMRDGLTDEVAWEGKSNHNGEVDVPGEYAGWPTLVRSPGLAFKLARLPEPNREPYVWWLELPIAEEETQVVVVDRENRPIVGAALLLGADLVWIRGKSLAWLLGDAGGDAKTDGQGVLRLRNLPSDQLSLLASSTAIDEIELGGYVQLAKEVDPAAPPMLVVRVLPTE